MLGIGADATDDADLRVRKVLMLSTVIMVAIAGVVWGAIYWLFGEPRSALIPWMYSVFALIGVAIFGVTRRYEWFAASNFTIFMALPFLLMWSLGGFVSGSMVALWAWLAPLGARIIGHRRAAFALFVAFAALVALSAAIQPRLDAENLLPASIVTLLFVLNIVAVGAVTLVLVDASSGGREGSVISMRAIVRRYFSPDVADVILADPSRQELGGEIADVTILFADLGGYTSFSDRHSPREVVELLNSLFAAALPAIHAQGGTPVQLPGDAVMAIFGAPRHAPDHAARAARAALAIQEASHQLVADHPDWPRFRIGINSGEALVGNIGSDEFRNFTAIGDTVNMAQRFQTIAKPGQVVTGSATAERLEGEVEVEWLSEVEVKGKAGLVRPCLLSAATMEEQLARATS